MNFVDVFPLKFFHTLTLPVSQMSGGIYALLTLFLLVHVKELRSKLLRDYNFNFSFSMHIKMRVMEHNCAWTEGEMLLRQNKEKIPGACLHMNYDLFVWSCLYQKWTKPSLSLDACFTVQAEFTQDIKGLFSVKTHLMIRCIRMILLHVAE
jgi:hypothetical protein